MNLRDALPPFPPPHRLIFRFKQKAMEEFNKTTPLLKNKGLKKAHNENCPMREKNRCFENKGGYSLSAPGFLSGGTRGRYLAM